MKDIPIEVLKAIRSDLGAFRKDMDAFRKDVGARFDGVDTQFACVDERLDNLAHRQVDSEMRIATALVGVAGALSELKDSHRADALRDQLRDHEARLTKLESRTG